MLDMGKKAEGHRLWEAVGQDEVRIKVCPLEMSKGTFSSPED